MQTQRFVNQVVLVSGGATGIGAKTCEMFAQEGAKVAINHAPTDRDRSACALLLKRIEAAGGIAMGFECDIAERAGVHKMVSTIQEKLGTVDILVSNAITGVFKNVIDLTCDDFERTLKVNLGGALWCTQACLPGMLKQGRGCVLYVSSNAVLNGGGGSVIYPASKGALEGLMNGLIYEWGKSGVRFNIIRPGPTNTETQRSRYTDQQWEQYQERLPMGRAGEPEEVANAILFMCDNQNAGIINGATLAVDGARTNHVKTH
jgi:NAD(P)-dependent dehydrogenase (short-subunit alcohol dehydrogenase family)